MARTKPSLPAEPPLSIRAAGVVKRLVREHGYGFIRDQEGRDYFFHHSELLSGTFEALVENQTAVSFEPTEGAKGLRANAVEIEEG